MDICVRVAASLGNGNDMVELDRFARDVEPAALAEDVALIVGRPLEHLSLLGAGELAALHEGWPAR